MIIQTKAGQNKQTYLVAAIVVPVALPPAVAAAVEVADSCTALTAATLLATPFLIVSREVELNMVSFLPQLDSTEGASLTGGAFALIAGAAEVAVEEVVLEAAAGALVAAAAAVTAVLSRVGTGLALRDATLPLLLFPPSTTLLLLVLGLVGSKAVLLGLLLPLVVKYEVTDSKAEVSGR